MVARHLKRKHKEFLAALKINHKEFLFLAQSAEYYKFYHVRSNKEVFIRR